MYNEELKTRFIREYTQSIYTAQNAKSIFNAMESYEILWGADLCTRSVDELQPAIDAVVGVRNSSGGRDSALYTLREYVKWCIAAKVPGSCDSLLHLDVSGIDLVRQRMVSSPLHLQKYLDAVFDKEEEQTIDNIYRCFCWLAYAGMDEQDVLSVTSTDIYLETLSIRYKSLYLPIYRESIQAFKNVMTLTGFSYKHPNYDKRVWRDRVSGDAILRGTKTVQNILNLRTELAKHNTKAVKAGRTDQALSYYRIWMSGLFYRMYERERAGELVDFSDAAMRFMEGKTYKGVSVKTKRNAVAKDYMEDYQRWKLAFSI